MEEQSKHQDHQNNNKDGPSLIGLHKYKILSICIVALAIACFCLSIFAMSTSVKFFSAVFGATSQSQAKEYLSHSFTWILAMVYLSIIGMVIVTTNTIVHFTNFEEKESILCLHLMFYLTFLPCGIVAIVKANKLQAQLEQEYGSECKSSAFKCQTMSAFESYKQQLISFFVVYCIFFLAYIILYHLYSFWKRKDREEDSFEPSPFKQPKEVAEERNVSFNTMAD